jgi:hypothetical protein
MNPRSSSQPTGSLAHEARIDTVLHAYSRAVPAPGLESRVIAYLSALPREPFRATRFVVLQRLCMGALAAAVAAAIVGGTVEHSRHAALPQRARASQDSGMSTAGAIHVPTRAVPETPTLDPASPRTPPHGRSNGSHAPDRHGAATGVPRSPYPPGQQ